MKLVPWLFAVVMLASIPAQAHWPQSPSPVFDLHLTGDSKGDGAAEIAVGYGGQRWAIEAVGAVMLNFDDSGIYALGIRPLYALTPWLDVGTELLLGYESSSTHGSGARGIASGIVRVRYKVLAIYWQPTFITTNNLSDVGQPSKLALRFGAGLTF
jgi:hypothetical protein